MKQVKKERKKNLFNSTFFLMACASAILFVPEYISTLWVNISKVMLVVTFVFSLIFYIRRGIVSKVFLLLAAFWLIMTISTIINAGPFDLLFRAAMASLQLCMVLELGCSTDRKKTLGVYALYFGVMAILNATTFLIFFNENEHFTGMYVDNRGDHNYYFLGQDNGTIYYVLPAVVFASLYSIESKKKISLMVYVFCGLILFSYLWIMSGNGIVTSLLLLVVLFIANTRLNSKILKKVGINKILITSIILFVCIAIARTNNPIMSFITNILGKDMTFTGRTAIWDTVLGHIRNKPILGYGFQTNSLKYSMIPLGKAHNAYLQVLYNGGFLSLILFYAIIKVSFGKNSVAYQKQKSILLLYVIVILVSYNFDFYIHHSMNFMPYILSSIYYVAEKKESHDGERKN